MRATCHRSSVQRRYCSGVFSLSHVVAIALWLVAAFLPLLLTLGSRGAWKFSRWQALGWLL